ncbi:nucleoporin autopeptidase [Actinidia rufa]|uniref:Nucleoporin autopeptidase n=1 Tax=Actinidia rufa TaxID=165716 RepID=A0A7J0H6B3_9ERIC|nr:nucleoporin autopeptidase [Actinidia rufa]
MTTSFHLSMYYGNIDSVFGQKPVFGGFGSSTTQANTFGSTFQQSQPAFGSSLFGSSTPFGASSVPAFGTSSTLAFGSTGTPAFGATSSPAFGATSTPAFGSAVSPAFGSTDNAFAVSSALVFGSGAAFGSSSTPVFGSSSTPAFAFSQSTSAFGGSPFNTSTSPFGTQSSPFGGAQATTPTFGSSGFGQSGFGGQRGGTPAFGANTSPSLFGSSSSSALGSSTSIFSTASAPGAAQAFGSGLSFANTQSSPLFQSTTPSLGQTRFGANLFPSTSSFLPTGNPIGFGQATPSLSTSFQPAQPSQTTGSLGFGNFGQTQAAGTSGFGGMSSIFGQNTFGQLCHFFSDDEETPSTPKADALFIPRENPRALVIRPLEQWPPRTNAEIYSTFYGARAWLSDLPLKQNPVENGVKEQVHPVKANPKPNGIHDDHSNEKGDSCITLTGHRAGEAAIVYEHGADIEALMPKLRHSDYYTQPRIQELAAMERAQPGFFRHVKDFVVGRNGYGSIRFIEETDVRRLDLESVVQFNNREVIVYMDESKKPPVGQGLNKPAEAEDQGAEFVSYDPIKGEWKFRVNHFSKYRLGDEDEDNWNMHATPGC